MSASVTVDNTTTAASLVAYMQTLANPDNAAGMARFGVEISTALGISNPDMRRCAKQAGRSHDRALELWNFDVREAKVLALLTADPRKLTVDQAWSWAQDFRSWEIVDMASDLFVEAALLNALVERCAADEREFVRRTAFAMIASAAVHLKKEPDETLIAYLPLIEASARDERNFVKKAVNWALRNIGKRSRACHGPAVETAAKLAGDANRTARWIGKDALRELTAEKTIARLKR